jgi:AcrR family transcriptional regulator
LRTVPGKSCNPDCDRCARLRAAVLAIVGGRGLEGVTLAQLSERAGVSVQEARAHYRDEQSCLADTYEEVAQSIYDDFAAVLAGEPAWHDALTRAARALLERLAARPAEARLCFVEILHADPELPRRRERRRQRLVDLFVSELGRRRDGAEKLRLQLELLIGAGFQLIAEAVASGETAGLPGIEPELVSRGYVFEPVAA